MTERLALSLFSFLHWRRKWQPTPVFLPRESQGRGSLVGCRLWGRTESDTTEVTQQQQCLISGFGVRVMLASQTESVFWKRLYGMVIVLFFFF